MPSASSTASPRLHRRESWTASSKKPSEPIRVPLTRKSSLYADQMSTTRDAKVRPLQRMDSLVTTARTGSTSQIPTTSTTVEVPIKLKRSHSSRRMSLLGTLTLGRSSRNVYEMHITSANYDTVMQQFQLRRLSCEDTEKALATTAESSLTLDEPARTARHLLQGLYHRLRGPIRPDGPFARAHALALVFLFHIQLIFLPLAATYFSHGPHAAVALHIVIELVLLVDLVLNFNTAYRDPKTRRVVISRRRIFWRYLRGWLIVDLASSIPINTLQLFLGDDPSTHSIWFGAVWKILMTGLRLVHLQTVIRGVLLTRALRLSRSLITWLLYSRYSHLLAIVKLLWLVVITAHYLACIRHYLVAEQTTNQLATGWSGYFSDFFYAICLLQGQGDGTQTDNIAANLFSILTVLLGSVLLAIVFGNVAMLVSNFNANETNYQRKLEGVVATMDKLHLPEPLRRRIHQYYTHLWSEYESLDGDIFHFSRELSHTLALEVGLCRYMNLITTISFWKDCSPDFITQIVLSLVVRVYLPHDYVIRKGEIGTELFMINRGICELDLLEAATSLGQSSPRRRSREAPPAADGRSYAQIRKLRHRNSHGGMEMYPGEVLGEMSLLMNYRRTANVLALTHVEMCILTRESFQVLITRYADDRRVVLQRMIQSCIERKCIPIPWQDMCVSTGVDVRELSPSAATAILVDRLDRNVVDETIKYGFQASDTLPSHENVSRGVDPAPPPHSNDAGALTQVLRQQAELANKVDALADVVRSLATSNEKGEACSRRLVTRQAIVHEELSAPRDVLSFANRLWQQQTRRKLQRRQSTSR